MPEEPARSAERDDSDGSADSADKADTDPDPDTSSTPDALERREEIRGRIEAAEGVLLGLDFDGTLSALVDEHDEAVLDEDVRPALERLAERPGVALVFVSGRGLADLRDRVDLDGAVYAGNHGLELGRDGELAVHPDAEAGMERIDRICETLADRLADVDGVAIENKGVTATVHFRRVADAEVDGVVETVERVVAEVDGVVVTEGNGIREIRPDVDWDKGDAMAVLSEAAPDDRRAVYLGDDVTDEDAFEAIQPDGLGVHIGGEGSAVDDTGAAYRLDDQGEVAEFLEWFDRVAPRPPDAPDGETGWAGEDPLDDPFDDDPLDDDADDEE